MKVDLIPECYRNFMAKPDETLFDHTMSLLECLEKFKIHLTDDEFELLRYCCIYHDIGKMNSFFQERVSSEIKLKFDPTKEIGHNILSFLFVFNNTADISINKDYLNLLFNIILNHHHHVNNISELDRKDNLGIINYKNTFEVQECKMPSKRQKGKLMQLLYKPTIRQAVLKGFFHKCDYSASAHSEAEIKNDGLINRLNSKGYEWNDMQKFAMDNFCNNIIIIGSTGMGKTEASLLWQGEGKAFYVLPVRTAINAMYKRIIEDFYTNDYTKQVGLLHSDMKNIYLKDESLKDETLENIDSFWEYYELTRNRALPLTICTPDQIFRFVFKYPGYEADLATFSYSRIIIDEIQAYSPELLAVLIYGLQLINKAGGKFAITTATFPPIIREWLDYEKDENGNRIENKINLAEQQFHKKQVRHKVRIIDDYINAEEIVDFYKINIDLQSLKILVVVNTVTSAQNLYLHISKQIGKENVKLLHSKFTVEDRKNLEYEIIEDGKYENNKHIIWIATQVVEASLDLDFDFLFTEFAELSSLFQRMGRCNRKGLKHISAPNIYVYEKIAGGLLCRDKAGYGTEKKGFIYYSLYELGKEALHKWKLQTSSSEMSEEDKICMINEFYNREKICEIEKNSSYSSYIKDYYDRYDRLIEISGMDIQDSEMQDSFRTIVSINAVPYDVYMDNFNFISSIENGILAKRTEIRESNDKAAREKLKTDVLKLKDEIINFTLSVEPRKADLNQYILDKWEKVYITRDSYRYNNEIGLHKSDNGNCEAMFW